jgi:threonine dehydratase
LGKRQITEFNYRYADGQEAHVFVGVQLPGIDARGEVLERLRAKGFSVLDMSDNETAKLHMRFMVGGHAPAVTDERLIRFEFPERPGALLNFLSSLGRRWNISLFHYRNHGAAYGRVLMGIQVPREEHADFDQLLADIGYRSWDETDNPAYGLFASAGPGTCRWMPW